MTVTVLSTAKPRLGRLLARPGGITIAEAVERAEAALAQMVVACREALDTALTSVDSAASALLNGAQDATSLKALYDAAEEVAGLSGPARREAVGAAAYSLCDLVDRYQGGAAVLPSALRVHLDALALLHRSPAELDDDVARALLHGLGSVVKAAA